LIYGHNLEQPGRWNVMEQSELRSIVRPVAAPASDVSAAEEEILLGLPLSALLILALLSLQLKLDIRIPRYKNALIY
jgi:hypothetical protein